MAPKRNAPAAAAKAPPKPRRSKLAKEHDISAEEESEIAEAFNIFRRSPSPSLELSGKELYIPTASLRPCLIALNAPPSNAAELNELVETVDPDDVGWIEWERFVAVAALKLKAKSDDPDARAEEVEKAYRLFTRGEERPITLADLKRVAKELREDVPDSVLKDMLREATGGGVVAVSMEEFESVMGRAGVFS